MGLMEAAVGAGGGIIETGMGLATANYNDKRQREQYAKLQGQQMGGQKEMAKFNQGLAIDTWNKTGMEAQRKQMEKAGLNVGLMYKGSGPGGTTSQGAAGPSGGGSVSAPLDVKGMGLQSAALSLMAEKQKAEIENINADTKNKEADVVGKGGGQLVANETIARTEKLRQDTANAAISSQLMEYEKTIKQIEAEIASGTKTATIEGIEAATKKLVGEAESAKNAGTMSTKAFDTLLASTKANYVSQGLIIEMQKKDLIHKDWEIDETKAKINKIVADIEGMYKGLEQQDKALDMKSQEVMYDRIRTEFNTSTPAQIQQITGIVGSLISGASKIGK